MKNEYFIDGWEEAIPTLKQAKTHVNDYFTSEEKDKNFGTGGYIYHSINGEMCGGVAFESKNGKIHFHRPE